MANLSNINNKFLVTTGGNVLIGQTSAVGSSIFQVTGNATFAGTIGSGAITSTANISGVNLLASTAVYSGGVIYGTSTLSLKKSNGNSYVDFDTNLNATFAGDVSLSDAKKLYFGAGNDLQIYHDAGSNSYIKESGEGALVFQSNDYYFQSNSSATVMQVIPSAGIIVTGYGNFTGTVETTTLRTDVVNNKANSANIIYRSGTDTIVGGGSASQKLNIQDNGGVYNSNSTAQTFFGSNNAGNPSNVTGASNSSFGYGAGNALTSGTQNVSFGRDAGGVMTTAVNNVNIGTNAGFSNTDGQQNVYVGTAAGYTSPGQNYNTFVGHESGFNNTANENTAVGRMSLQANTSGNRNVGIGFNALRLNTTGVANTALGALALENNIDGNSNTALGYQAADANTAGDANTAIGTNSLGANSTGSRNTTVGHNSGLLITGSDTVAIGYEALATLTSSGQNIGIGVLAANKFTGSRLVAIGYAAGKELLSDVDNVFIGQQAGENRTAGADNTFIGAYANYNGGSTGGGNTGVGKSSGFSLTSGASNTLVGRQAGYSITDGNDNTMVGWNSGIFVTGSGNTYMGTYSGDASSHSGSYNTGVGRAALSALTTGQYNTTIGYNAGDEATTGDYNICIGNGAGSASSPFNLTTQSGRVVIGDNSIGNAYIKVDWTITSDKRDKTDFKEIPHGLDFVNKLKPTEYKFRKQRETEETDGIKRYGFLAQDILELEGENPVIIDVEQKDSLKYKQSHLVPILVKAIQELKAEIDELKK